MTKICSKCKVEQPLDGFSKSKATTDGRVYKCKKCTSKYHKEWAARNKEKIRDAKAKRWKANIEHNHKMAAAWRKKNDAKVQAARREWAKNNPIRVRAAQTKWAKNNPDKIQARQVSYLETNAYIRGQLKKHTMGAPIPPELIEAKRTHLKMVRTLKEK